MYLEWALFRDAAYKWLDHNAPRRGAALAYYTILSLAPLLVIVIAFGGIFFGKQSIRGEISVQMRHLMGYQGAQFVSMLLNTEKEQGAGIVASGLGFIVLLLGASGVFVELRQTLNEIWDAPNPDDSGLLELLRSRFLSFAMILAIGLLLLLSVAASTVLHYASAQVQKIVPLPEPAIEAVDFIVALVATGVLFALVYRFIPEVNVGWEDVVIGSALTALLFNFGRILLAIYLTKAGVGSAYGAAGSMVVLLVWVYYSSQIFLYGAEITRVYSDRRAGRTSNLQPK